ncbi:methyltransferase family protein [Halopolyspora algeriensis]|uniref:Methyltransferase family protein n=1 Tax=Halopolyspora algeriensis TaxID=1500506 RepID=A0A368W0K0_9ACTN|nr:class I SAM-dependent methyltransferase [Halopolyspora algeriensis]RCW46111.1 methyltransferase family protein [Halopolyspora algeriensis]TQM55514.1 methyltransferase family protein [Halopolyspora algeriensis]
MSEEFDKAYWEEHYHGRTAPRGEQPNPHLVAEAGQLQPGTALDAGCGHGTETRWLASRGWQVTAVDLATTALHHARERAEALGGEVTNRITWVEADLTAWAPTEETFDLVTTHYVHPAGSREALFGRLAAAVAPGGTLLVVGHHPCDSHSTAHASGPQVHFTAEEIAADLDPDRWDIAVAETRTRSATGHGEGEITLHDTVLRARKHP